MRAAEPVASLDQDRRMQRVSLLGFIWTVPVLLLIALLTTFA